MRPKQDHFVKILLCTTGRRKKGQKPHSLLPKNTNKIQYKNNKSNNKLNQHDEEAWQERKRRTSTMAGLRRTTQFVTSIKHKFGKKKKKKSKNPNFETPSKKNQEKE